MRMIISGYMPDQPQRLGYLEGWLSIVLNVILFGFKYWAGLKSDSVAMIADAWHTMSDTFTSVIIVISFMIAALPADKQHPFGHGRAEVISAIVIGTALALVGFNFLKESIMRLQNYQAAQFASLAIIVFVISVILKEALAQFSIWAGRKIHSQALLADGWHHRSDAIASGLIVVGALAGGYLWWIDGVMGICVSALILYATYDILKGSVSSLLGERIDPLLEYKIKNLTRRIAPAVSCLHHVHVHRYGDHIEVSLHIKLPHEMTVKEAHDLATRLEDAMRREMNVEPTIHIEPQCEPEET